LHSRKPETKARALYLLADEEEKVKHAEKLSHYMRLAYLALARPIQEEKDSVQRASSIGALIGGLRKPIKPVSQAWPLLTLPCVAWAVTAIEGRYFA